MKLETEHKYILYREVVITPKNCQDRQYFYT